MKYKGTVLTDALSVKEIFSVLRPDICRTYPGRGEAHPFPEIFYLSRGKHTLLIDKKEYSLEGGQMVIYAPDSFHEASRYRPQNAEVSVLSFDAESEILSSMYNTVITLTAGQRARLASIVEEGVGYFYYTPESTGFSGMSVRPEVDPAELWGLKKQIELFLIDLYRYHTAHIQKNSKSTKWDAEFQEVVSFLEEHLSDPLTLEKIAKASSMSVSKLKLLFREKAGTGPIDYLLHLRIERAGRLIREEKLNFTEISMALGFSSLHYFSRVFKRVTGMSPSEYAKKG